MENHKIQHIVPATVVLALALIVTYLSFTQEPAEPYQFPRVISIFFVLLAIWNFIRAVSGMAKVGRGIAKDEMRNLFPGIAVMLVYVFFAAKFFGFYVSSTIAFFLIYSLYDPAPFSSSKDWIKRALITTVFMAVIYALFSMLLQVQTPRGMFI